MKKVIVKNWENIESPLESFTAILSGEHMTVSDGYHTFDELYEHRIALFIRLAYVLAQLSALVPEKGFSVWRSLHHSDGTHFEGWFIMGLEKEAGKQITYHLPASEWDNTSFAETLDRAPEWDKHTSAEALERIKNL